MSYAATKLEQIALSKTNPRKHFDGEAMKELTDSVRRHGVLQPILIRPIQNGKVRYELVAGERRFRAAQTAKLKEIPAMVQKLSDQEALELQVIENLQRSNLHPMEEAQGYQQLLGVKGYDAAKIAERVGRSVKYIYDRIKLLNLIEPIRKVFLEGKITAGHAILLARLAPTDQKRALGGKGKHGDFNEGGLWQSEASLFTGEGLDAKDPLSGYKARSVRELESWIQDHVRFEAEKADAFLFPELAQTVKQAKEQAEKIVSITHDHYVQKDARTAECIIGPQSWKEVKGKLCAHAVTGVIVVGEGRGKAFKICINKEKCKTHWGQWQKERAARKKQSAKDGGTAAQRHDKDQKRREAQEAKKEAERARWRKATPALLDALAKVIKKAPTKAGGALATAVLSACTPDWGQTLKAEAWIPRGTTAQDFLRHAAFLVFGNEIMNEYEVDEKAPKILRAFGLNARKIVDQAAPVQTSAKPAVNEKEKK